MFGKLIVKKTCYYLKSPLAADFQPFIPHLKRQLQHRAAAGAAGAARHRSLPKEVISIPSLLGSEHNTQELPGWRLLGGRIFTPLLTGLANASKSKLPSELNTL